jgi:hypothetical protein
MVSIFRSKCVIGLKIIALAAAKSLPYITLHLFNVVIQDEELSKTTTIWIAPLKYPRILFAE